MSHIHRHRQMRMNRIGGCRRTADPNLLLGRGHADHLGRQFFLLRQTHQSLPDDISPHLVVERTRRRQTSPQHLQFMVVGRHIADRHPLQSLRLAFRSNIDPHLVLLRDFFPVLVLHQMNRPLPGHPQHRPVCGLDYHTPTGNY